MGQKYQQHVPSSAVIVHDCPPLKAGRQIRKHLGDENGEVLRAPHCPRRPEIIPGILRHLAVQGEDQQYNSQEHAKDDVDVCLVYNYVLLNQPLHDA